MDENNISGMHIYYYYVCKKKAVVFFKRFGNGK